MNIFFSLINFPLCTDIGMNDSVYDALYLQLIIINMVMQAHVL